MLEIIKSYLVSLGFQVDKASYSEATKVMDEAGHSVSKFAGASATQFAVAGVAVATFAITATLGIAKFIGSLGDAQIKNEMLARQLWTTQENAMAFNTALKATGATLQELYLSPTLMEQFQQLRQEAFTLAPPAEYKQQMEMIQSISFEFKRMKLEGTYALQWIGYYFIKYMSGPIGDIKTDLSDINDKIIKTMPNWTKVVAQVMSWFAQFGITTVRAIKDLDRGFNDIGQDIPKNMKLIGAAIGALALVVETGPVGILIGAFTILILLLNDFYTYLDGGESELGPFWKKLMDLKNQFDLGSKLEDFKKKIKDAMKTAEDDFDSAEKKVEDFWDALEANGAIDNFGKTLQNILDIESDELQVVIGWIEQMWGALGKTGELDSLVKDFEDLTGNAAQLSEQVSSAVKQFLELKGTQEVLKTIGGILGGVIVAALQTINNLIKGMADGVKGWSYLMKGDYWDAAKSFASMVTDQFTTPNLNYLYPSASNATTNNNQKTTFTNNPTYNIYGSDPNQTAKAANDYTVHTMMNFRNLQGIYG